MRDGSNAITTIDNNWYQEVLQRFHDRENLSKDELYSRYFEKAGLPKDEVFACFKLLESEYDIPAGLLRPQDKLEKLFMPVPAKSPWRWLVYRTREGDSQTEINYELGRRMRRAGTVKSWSHIKNFADITFFDLVNAWCGKAPS